jgi:starch synthase (maltosyl-transferring)
LRNLTFHHVDDEQLLAFSKKTGDDVIIFVANTDPHATRESTVRLDLSELGLAPGDTFTAHDLLTDASWQWGSDNYVRLGPDTEPVHIVHLRRF